MSDTNITSVMKTFRGLFSRCRRCGTQRDSDATGIYCEACRDVVLSQSERQLRGRIVETLRDKPPKSPSAVARELDMPAAAIANVMWAMADDRELMRVGDTKYQVVEEWVSI